MRGLQSPITKGLCDKSLNLAMRCQGYLANADIILQVYVVPNFQPN